MFVRNRLLYFVTEDWYFVSHRLPLALAVREAGFDVSVVTRVRDCGDIIRDAGLSLIPIEIERGSRNPLAELTTLRRLVAVYRNERPQVVHHVAVKPVLYGSLAARISGVPAVINALAGLGWAFTDSRGAPPLIRPLVQAGMRLALRRGVALVQNPSDAHFVHTLGVESERVRVILGSGVDLERFRPSPEPDGPVTIVLPARLLWHKGVAEFVEAARILKTRNLPVRCLLAGDPDEANPSSIPDQSLAAWVEEGVVEHLGWVTDMPRLLSESHVVCLPSYAEGAPKSLLEAAAAGLPVVTTNVRGCRAVVREGETGLLVPPRDGVRLADALESLVVDGARRREMGLAAREFAEDRFGLDRVVRETLGLYEQALCASS